MKPVIIALIVGVLTVHAASASPILSQDFEGAAYTAGESLALTPEGDGTTVGGVWGNPYGSNTAATAAWSPHVVAQDNDLITGGTKSLHLFRADSNFRSGGWYGRRTDAGLTGDFVVTFYLSAEAFYNGSIRVGTRAADLPSEEIGLNITSSSTAIYGSTATSTLLQDHPDVWHGFRLAGNVADGIYDVYQLDGSQASPVWQKITSTSATFDNTVLTEVSGLAGLITSTNGKKALLDDISIDTVIPEPASAAALGLLSQMAFGRKRNGLRGN